MGFIWIGIGTVHWNMMEKGYMRLLRELRNPISVIGHDNAIKYNQNVEVSVSEAMRFVERRMCPCRGYEIYEEAA